MKTFSILAVVATVAALSGVSQVAAGPGDFAPGGGGGGGCGLCGPGGFAPNPGGGGGGGGGGSQTSPGDPFMPGFAESCDTQMGKLRPVKSSQVRGVDTGDSVDVVEVCADDLQRNIAQLRPHIAANDVLDAHLDRSGFDAGDVIGIKVRGASVVLYVR